MGEVLGPQWKHGKKSFGDTFAFGESEYRPTAAKGLHEMFSPRTSNEGNQIENLFDLHPEALPTHVEHFENTNLLQDHRSYAGQRAQDAGYESPDAARGAYRNDQHLLRRQLPPEAPASGDAPRTNYRRPIPGQQVMPEPGREHLNEPLEINKEGNLFQESRFDRHFGYNGFDNWGPQMTRDNQEMWDRHAKPAQMSTMSVLHTAQNEMRRPAHDHIIGPMDPGNPVRIMVHKGTPWIMDGHHRLAEARGRGHETFHASVLNLDQLGPEATSHRLRRD